MTDDLLIHIDRLDTRPSVFEGTFVPADLERLQDSLADGRGELRYRISACLDPQRRKVVSCIIEGFVFLTCQISLEAFRYEVSVSERLILVDSEAQLPAIEEESESEDYVVADGPLDIRDLVEDAVLLALPMIARKPGLEEAKAEASGADERVSPFAALAGLRRPK
ncbi:MAG: YceD family protein [Betaproteobacteria bacterium]